MWTHASRSLFSQRLREISRKRIVSPTPTEATNSHADTDSAARDRFLQNLNRRPR